MPEGYLLMSASEAPSRSHTWSGGSLRESLSQREAAERLGIGVRQMKRLVRAWKRQGDHGLVSRQRGRAAHNRLSEATRLRIEPVIACDLSRLRPRPGFRKTGGTGRDCGLAGDGPAHSDTVEAAQAEEAGREARFSDQGPPPPGSVNWSRLTAVRTIGLKAARHDAR